MKWIKLFILSLVLLFLAACTTTQQAPIVKTDVVRVYPDLPPLEELPP